MAYTATIPVRFSDIDHAGVVYFAKFFDYCHQTLEEFLRSHIGARAYADILNRDRIGFPVIYTDCKFSAPLRFGDTVEVELSIERMGRTSISFAFRMFRQPPFDTAGDTEAGATPADARVLCAQGSYVTAIVDLDRFESAVIPDTLREIFAPLVVPGSTN